MTSTAEWRRLDVNGQSSLVVKQRSLLSDWTVVAWAPADIVTKPLADAFWSLLAGGVLLAALVVLVVWAFLGSLRSALIPSLAIPVSLVGSFTVMYLCDFSLNNLSVMALIVATGLVVDDAVKSAILLQTATIYENREPAEVAQVQGLQIPNVIKWLLDPYRLGMGV